MRIKEPTSTIPRPSGPSIMELIRDRAPAGFVIPEWIRNLVVVAYQNGRYDEASAETFGASFD